MTKVRILFLASNPFEQTSLAIDEEVRAITAQIRSADHRDAFELISGWAVRPTTYNTVAAVQAPRCAFQRPRHPGREGRARPPEYRRAVGT